MEATSVARSMSESIEFSDAENNDKSLFPDLGGLLTNLSSTEDPVRKLDIAKQICRAVNVPSYLELKILQQLDLSSSKGSTPTQLADVLLAGAIQELQRNTEKSAQHRIDVCTRSSSVASDGSSRPVHASVICQNSRIGNVYSPQLIETPTTLENLRRLTRAVDLQSPILVQGEVGCGKSFLIRELAKSMGQDSTLVELHLDDQTDSKTLLGAYVCSDVPGELLWQPGVITQAALSGRWLIIEDIDKTPLEVAAALSSLLERRRLYLPEKGREVPVHSDFRLFGTRSLSSSSSSQQQRITSKKSGKDHSNSNSGSAAAAAAAAANHSMLNAQLVVPALRHFSYFWHFVTMDLPGSEEIRHIVSSRFPMLLPGTYSNHHLT